MTVRVKIEATQQIPPRHINAPKSHLTAKKEGRPTPSFETFYIYIVSAKVGVGKSLSNPHLEAKKQQADPGSQTEKQNRHESRRSMKAMKVVKARGADRACWVLTSRIGRF